MTDAVRIYLLDTLTLWNVHAHMSEAESLAVIESLKSQYGAIEGIAELRAVADTSAASDAKVKAQDELSQVAFASVLYGLTTTETYDQALKRHGSIEGHWLYLLYRMTDGNIIGRPGFARSPTSGYLPPRDLKQVLISTLKQDLASSVSKIGATIERHGGLNLAPEFSKAL